MNQKIIGGLLGLGSCMLVGLGAFLYVMSDREAPVISIPENVLAYTEGTEQSQLLEGVTAYDNVDKDVTSSLKVEKIIVLGEEAKVTYVARDKNNNISKKDRIIQYSTDPSTVNNQVEETQNLEDTETLGDTEIGNGESESGIEKDSNDDNSTTQNSIENQDETSVSANGDIVNEDQSELVSTGPPVIRLNRYKIHLKKGASLNTMNYVQGVKDDKDNENDLYRRIRVEGTYDVNTIGSYEITYYVTDSDGNESNIEKLTVVIQ